jgi:hypothetical protein
MQPKEVVMVKSQSGGTLPETVECVLCKKLIPPSEAVSPEGHDYVLYFCGADCRAEWERQRAEQVEREFEERSGVKRD